METLNLRKRLLETARKEIKSW